MQSKCSHLGVLRIHKTERQAGGFCVPFQRRPISQSPLGSFQAWLTNLIERRSQTWSKQIAETANTPLFLLQSEIGVNEIF